MKNRKTFLARESEKLHLTFKNVRPEKNLDTGPHFWNADSNNIQWTLYKVGFAFPWFAHMRHKKCVNLLIEISMLDPELFIPDPDPTFQFVSDPNPDPTWFFSNIFLSGCSFWRDICLLGEYYFFDNRHLYFLIENFCWEIVKFYQFVRVVLLQIHFGSGSC